MKVTNLYRKLNTVAVVGGILASSLALAFDPAKMPQLGKGGSMDAGGGNVVGSDVPTLAQIKNILPYTGAELLIFLNFHQKQFKSKLYVPTPLKLLFENREESNLELAERLWSRIDFRAEDYCTVNDVHRDGSFNKDALLPICISGKGVAENSKADALPQELFGLLAHEVAHALGANEEQANAVQRVAKSRHREFQIEWIPEERPDIYWNKTLAHVMSVENYLGLRDLSRAGALIACYMADDLDALVDTSREAHVSAFSAFDYDGEAEVTRFYLQFKNALMYACSRDDSSDPTRVELARNYREIYAKSNETTAWEIFVNGARLTTSIWPEPSSGQFTKIETREQLKAATVAAGKALKRVKDQVGRTTSFRTALR